MLDPLEQPRPIGAQDQRRAGRRPRCLRVLAAVLLLGLAALPALWGATGRAAAAEATELTLDDAVQRALVNDPDLKLAELTLESARITYERNLANNLLTDSPITRKQTELAWKKAQATYRQAKNQAISQAVLGYLDLQISEQNLDVRRRQLALSEQSLEVAQQKLAAGTASRLDVQQAELDVMNARNAYDRDREAYRRQLRDYLETLGLAGSETAVRLTSSVDAVPAPEPLERFLELAMASSTSIEEAQVQVEVAEAELEQARLEGQAPLDLRAAENQLAMARLQYDRAVASARASVESSHTAARQAVQSLEAARLTLSLRQQELEVARGQERAGLKRPADVEQATIAVISANNSLRSSIRSAVQSLLDLRTLIGVDPVYPFTPLPAPAGADNDSAPGGRAEQGPARADGGARG